MKTPLFLCIETATKLCSVALTKGSKVIYSVEKTSDQYIHAESLHPFIEKLFLQVDYKMSDVDAIVVAKGPGSYTGLRIGVSTSKGLAYSLDLPIIAVNSLEGIASAALNEYKDFDYIAPVIDARREEVYTLLMDQNGQVKEQTKAEVLGTSFYEAYQTHKILIVGDASEKVEKLLSDTPNFVFNHKAQHLASNLSIVAEKRYKKQEFEDVAYFEPYYLKEFIAGKPKRQFKKL